ncbi:MAG: class I SAM-dependent methyltransferase [Sedimentisphaerales bacterium]|nr:class I SAM-dependent methyltransferase [Sedimentisphaerales bacterium]
MEHSEIVRREFSRQAANFGENGLTLSSQEYLAWIVDILPFQSDFRVLDVAAGTGHLSRMIAPHVRQVIAIDMTKEMLEQARKAAAEACIENILFEEGDAAALPYQDNSFDMVVSRFAIHHFEKPELQLKEMVRVSREEHAVGIIDMLSPADESLISPYNRLEQMRDPSHTVALTKEQLTKAMEISGLLVQQFAARDINVDFERWTEMTGTDRQTKLAIRSELEREIAGGSKTGMRPYLEGGKLKFLQTWCVVTGTKPSNEQLLRNRPAPY